MKTDKVSLMGFGRMKQGCTFASVRQGCILHTDVKQGNIEVFRKIYLGNIFLTF